MSEAQLAISSRAHANKVKRRFDAVLSIAAPGAEVLRFHRSPSPAQLVLRMDDIVSPEPRGVLPTREQVVEGLEFARRFVNLRLLIQCEAGVSRSGAFGIAILAGRLGSGREQEALEDALRIAPAIIPNLLIIRLADEVLGFGGAMMVRMSRALRSMSTRSRLTSQIGLPLMRPSTMRPASVLIQRNRRPADGQPSILRSSAAMLPRAIAISILRCGMITMPTRAPAPMS
jgi:predicted protein tyrosine phosphatase